ncbi:Calcineurin-binding protein cabin-1 [Fasciolopsis buskii]|uniref:Calcineurin-binding protein cabin-1 n=1 Tax=Fasciolopsis buskii TaxID=27845 RepID=A0A8E0RMH8_9TREM|nr:Calcineurin-binding protein cabin-1 [Fasciolopsis buski]
MYRLADVYLRAPHLRDPMKALSILLGPVDDAYKSTVGGLFKDRKQNNFFHGVWRIPTSDIDRSGNFAAHMFRSVSLTLDTLSERGDWRHLVHIFHQLRKQPPEDKRGFLGEGDRVYLARRAFNLIQPTLLIWLNQLSRSLSGNMQNLLAAVAHSGHVDDPSVAPQALSSSDPSQMGSFINLETLTQIYRLHCVSYSRNCLPGVSPNRTNKESSPSGGPNDGPSSLGALEISGFAEVLTLAYRLCPSAWVSLTDL